MKRLCGICLLAMAALVPVDAQIGGGTYPPGQYPPGQYPPGQYPPGRDPNDPNRQPGGGGLSLPHKHKKGTQSGDNASLNTISADGFAVSISDKKLVVVVDDGRTLTMTVDAKTAYNAKDGTTTIPASKIEEGTFVHVVAAEDDEDYLTAVTVNLLREAGPRAPGEAPVAGDPTAPPVDPKVAAELAKPAATDAPDRPILRRGKPAGLNEYPENETPPTPPKPKATANASAPKKDTGDFTITPEDSQHPKVAGDDEQIARSREWADTFTQGLPNYLVQQITTRYQEESRSSGWTPIDVVTAKVIVEKGEESYRDITVGGRKTNKSMMEIGGSTSTGEFAGYLQALLLTNAAQFKFSQSTAVQGTPASIYNFTIPLKKNRRLWTIIVGGQSLQPQYSGAVWIEKATGQVRRIEFQADRVPKDFPLDSVETAVDYEPIRLGTGTFLPVHAAGISCRRGTSICSKNEIDFRDYHKYSGESTIVYK
jgi:hypothetical protein